jgi:hypothetical protein
MSIRLLIFILLHFIFFSFTLHPFHVSVTELTYNQSTQTYQLSKKIFINDFEDVLALRHNTLLDIYKEVDEEKSHQIYNFYIDKHLAIFGNQQPVKMKIIGAEIEDSAVWIYAESEMMPAPKEIFIKNTALCDFFNDQINIVTIKMGEKKQMKRLVCTENEWKAFFEK